MEVSDLLEQRMAPSGHLAWPCVRSLGPLCSQPVLPGSSWNPEVTCSIPFIHYDSQRPGHPCADLYSPSLLGSPSPHPLCLQKALSCGEKVPLPSRCFPEGRSWPAP